MCLFSCLCYVFMFCLLVVCSIGIQLPVVGSLRFGVVDLIVCWLFLFCCFDLPLHCFRLYCWLDLWVGVLLFTFAMFDLWILCSGVCFDYWFHGLMLILVLT